MIHRKIGKTLQFIKPVVGLLALLYTPSAAWLLWQECIHLIDDLPYLYYFGGGCVGYLLLWIVLLRRSSISFLSTLEHELTHALFALITFNKVTGLKATWRQGGHTDYEGTAHWLIHLAPYFFPTFSVVLLIPFAFAPPLWLPWVYLALGISVGYHLSSTLTETHLNQKDLKLAGWVFCICFLPFANLMAYLLLLTGLEHGGAGILSVLSQLPFTPYKPDPWLISAWQLALKWWQHYA
jgi:hypothetical protein